MWPVRLHRADVGEQPPFTYSVSLCGGTLVLGRRPVPETPKSVVFAADLPETVGGKVLKYKLRAGHAGHYGDVAETF